MKAFVRNSLIKLFVFMFVVCAAVTIATLPNSSKVDAATVSTFKVIEDASIRNGGEDDSFTGLQFAFSFNQSWLDANRPVSGSIGLLVFPSKNANSFVASKSIDENLEAVDGIKYLGLQNKGGYLSASIVFDRDYIISLIERPTQKKLNAVLNNLYSMDFTAIAFAQMQNGSFYYTNSYTTSVMKTAARIVSGETTSFAGKEIGEDVKAVAETYLGNVVSQKSYVMANDNKIENFEVQTSEISQVVIENEELVLGTDYNVTGNALEFSAGIVAKYAQAENNANQYVNVYVFDENRNVTILNVLFGVDQVIDSVEEFKAVFVKGEYDANKVGTEAYAPNNNTYILGADIDLANEGVIINKTDRQCFEIPATTNYTTFNGILDGFGYAISNASVKTTHAGGSGNYPAGLLGDFDKDSILKNVAFENIGTDAAGSFGLITGQFFGAMENVYAYVNETVPYGVSTFGNVIPSARFENVVLKVDRADNYVYPQKSQGSVFGGRFNSGVEFGDTSKNIVVIVNEPLAYQKNAYEYGVNETKWHEFDPNKYSDFATTATIRKAVYKYNTDAEFAADKANGAVAEALLKTGLFKFVYNEIVWHSDYTVEFSVNGAELKAVELSKVDANYASEVEFLPQVTVDGIATYDVADITVTPYEGSPEDAIVIADGKIIANKVGKVKVTLSYEVNGIVYAEAFDVNVNGLVMNELVEFEASSGLFKATSYQGDVNKVTVTAFDANGNAVVTKILTLANGGISADGKLKALASYDENNSDAVGVPYASNAAGGIAQKMAFAVETTETTYTYVNVIYYNEIIDNVAEMKSFASHEYLDENKQDFGYYKLGADIEFVGNEDFSNANITHGVNGDFGYSKQSQGFLGIFDGAGHYIKNLNQGNGGLFGALRNWTDVTTVVKNLALIDVKKSSHLLGQAGPYYKENVNGVTNALSGDYVILDNIYISYAEGVQSKGLFERIGVPAAVLMNNVVIDSSSTNSSYKLAKDNKAYGITDGHALDRSTSAVGSVFAINLHVNYSGRDVRSAVDFENAQTNVILVGRTPFLSSASNKTVNATLFTHTANGDGTYSHAPVATAPFGSFAAGNLETSDVPYASALKAGFAELAKNSDGSTLAGFICKTCYEGFSASAGVCSCGAALSSSANLWNEVGSYEWSLYDLDSHESGIMKDVKYKHAGISKYDTVADMPTDASAYASFTGATGNDCWKIYNGKLTWKTLYDVEFSVSEDVELSVVDSNKLTADFAPQVTIDNNIYNVTEYEVSSDCIEIADGKITAKAVGTAVVTLKYTLNGKVFTSSFNVIVSDTLIINDAVEFEASSGLLKTTAYDGDINKVIVTAYDVVGNPIVKELTVANGGILADGKLKVLTSYDDTYGDVVGVPYANNLVSVTKLDNKGITQQMRFVVETTVGKFEFANVIYYTDIIENETEFVALANWDYKTNYINANYYKLGTNINAEGLTYDKRAAAVTAVFNYPSQASAYAGFRGRFDGDGHTISNFNPAASANYDYGLFGAIMSYDDHTQTFRQATQIVIENVAFVNIYSGPVLGKYAPTSRSKSFFDANESLTLLENIYVSVKEGETLRGLFGGKGGTRDQNNLNSMNIDMKNIVIDATKANVKLAKDNKAYLVEGADGQLVNQFEGTNVVDFQESYAIFGAWIQTAFHSGFNNEMVTRFVNEACENVVILGNVPVALRRSTVGDNNKNNSVAHIANGDGTYTHQAKAKLEINDVYAYACNQTVGDIPVITGLKPAFLAADGISTNDGSRLDSAYAYVCYVCGTPYKGWAQNCPNTECGLNQNLYGTWCGNTWTSPAIYTYTVRDLTNFEHDIPNFTGLMTGNYEFVLQGVYKYNDGAIKASEVDLDAFKATGFWSVVDGELLWGNPA